MEIPAQLLTAISRMSDRPASPAVGVLIDEILARHGEAAQGVLFYGSCLRSGDELDGLVDLYLLVDDYRKAFKSRWQAFLNALLPPNVYYLERWFQGNTVRTKYAVLSLADFQKGTSLRWFHSYLWGRFCQPTALLYARNADVKELVQQGFAQSVMTFISCVLPMVSHEFTARQLWSRGLTLSYGAELRSEKPEKRGRLFNAAPDYYEEVTRLAIHAMAVPVEITDSAGTIRYRPRISEGRRWRGRLAWRMRSALGKLLSILRLVKATFTFEGGVDYILWKIERHSGVAVDVEPRLKRHPLLAMGVLAWRLYRKGGFH
jgi:Phosphatidate cytidylyltransferase, mitochondrial